MLNAMVRVLSDVQTALHSCTSVFEHTTILVQITEATSHHMRQSDCDTLFVGLSNIDLTYMRCCG